MTAPEGTTPEGIATVTLDDGTAIVTSTVLGTAVIKDGIIEGGTNTGISAAEWHRAGVFFAQDGMAIEYIEAVGMLFLQGNLEEIAALRSGWREGGGRDWAQEA